MFDHWENERVPELVENFQEIFDWAVDNNVIFKLVKCNGKFDLMVKKDNTQAQFPLDHPSMADFLERLEWLLVSLQQGLKHGS